jgi:glycosyltransferase involved in cell wall biosynthesis
MKYGFGKQSMNPRVSICIPTLNGAKYLEECVRSAVSQTFEDLEILIVDDYSTDDTIEIARTFKDRRIRILQNERTLGLAENWNEAIRNARGDFIKFLFQDDWLYPHCVEAMHRMFSAHPELGLVFARRKVLVEDDAPPEFVRTFLASCSEQHLRVGKVRAVNQGRSLFAQHLSKELYLSCVGEPPSTLIRREVFERVGLFNTRIYQVPDTEMWLRIMFFYDVGFLDEKLGAFRLHGRSTSVQNRLTRRDLFDHFWLLEGLLSHPEIPEAHPEILEWRNDLWRHYRKSLTRPHAGFRSIGSRSGFSNAVRDFRELPQKVKFLKEVNRYHRDPTPLHARL